MLQCTGGKTDSCLSSAQVGALKSMFAGPRNSAGKALYTGQPWDAGLAAPGWRSWTLGNSTTATPDARYITLMVDALVNEFFTPPDLSFNPLAFNFDTDPARMAAYSAIYDTYADDKLVAYKQRSGKLLFIHGMSDPIFSALDTMDYYERLVANNGGVAATQSFARTFLVPGMNHCSGGPATDNFDSIQTMVDWVEKALHRKALRPRRCPPTPTSPTARVRCAPTRSLPSTRARAVWKMPAALSARRVEAQPVRRRYEEKRAPGPFFPVATLLGESVFYRRG